jgi:hypothetical protein
VGCFLLLLETHYPTGIGNIDVQWCALAGTKPLDINLDELSLVSLSFKVPSP